MPSHSVGLFITCLTDQFYPRVGIAVTKVLERLGCRVSFPEGQTCCGQPMSTGGMVDEAGALAVRWAGLFESSDWIVTPSASCCAMVREQYPRLPMSDSDRARVSVVAGRTYEFTEFLDKVLKYNPSRLKLSRKVSATYHPACHQRALGRAGSTERVLRKIGNLDFRVLPDSDQCCGFGGGFSTQFPEVSGAIARAKVAQIASTSAELAVCNDAGCAMNIAGTCHRAAVPVQVVHLAELMAEGLGLDLSRW